MKDKDKEKGEWKCLDCSKTYKSYPAFYTHNKLKHKGKPPNSYDIPRSLEDIRKDRGRPRVVYFKHSNQYKNSLKQIKKLGSQFKINNSNYLKTIYTSI